MAEAIAALGASDLQVLIVIREIADLESEQGEGPENASRAMMGERNPGGVSRSALVDRWPGATNTVDASLALLTAQGLLIGKLSIDGDLIGWKISPFGEAIRRRFLDESSPIVG
jgi:hypothetical protein